MPDKKSSAVMSYDQSPIPSAGGTAGERHPDRKIGVNESGRMTYDSASAEGRTEIELPTLPGSPNAVERLHAADFPGHVIAKIEAALTRQPYLRSGAVQDATQVFQHYTAVARGAGLMDAGTLERMEGLAKEFKQELDREEFFSQMVKPWLLSRTPERRR